MRHPILVLMAAVAVWMGASGLRSAGAADVLSNLRLEQGIVLTNGSYEAAAPVRIAFQLRRPADVTIRIARHLAAQHQYQARYVAEPWPVRTLQLGRLPAGTHEAVWDGLDEQGQPVEETNILSLQEVRQLQPPPASSDQLTKRVPVNLFQITVQAGQDFQTRNFERLTGSVSPTRETLSFMGAVRDREGRIVVADRMAWRGRRYSTTWQLETTFPVSSTGHSSDPVECQDAAVDSRGNVYLFSPAALYKFGADGNPAAWEADAEHLNYPYPSVTRNVLGWRLDPNAKDKKEYVFGPGGGGARKYWDTAEMIQQPGFAFAWGGVAIGAEDRIYLGERAPVPRIQVFERTGKFLRHLPLPERALPLALRATADGNLWVATERGLLLLDASTGEVRQTINCPARQLYLTSSGILFAYRNQEIWRFKMTGEPLPFADHLPGVRPPGNLLDLRSQFGAEMQIFGLAGSEDGSFFVSERPAGGQVPSRLMQFAADGSFIPDWISVEVGQRVPGNVFLNDAPATFDLFINNLSDRPATAEALWTLTDFDGRQTTGTAPLTLAPRARQTIPLTVPLPEWGHYRLGLRVRRMHEPVPAGDAPSPVPEGWHCEGSGSPPKARRAVVLDRRPAETGDFRSRTTDLHGPDGPESEMCVMTISESVVQCARIPSRKIEEDRWSPFAIVWGTDYYLMSQIGAKSQRGDSASWSGKVEPLDGVFYPDPPEAIQYTTGGIGSYQRYARRWGLLPLHMFNYGEAWLGGGFPACRIHSYDRFFGYVMRVVDTFAGQGEAFYQFWNEPNFFWHVPGPFSREHFALVQKHVWSIVKARDKNALAIADGDAGGLGIMEEFVRYGANEFSDGVQFHYPGAQTITFNNMPVPDQPEGKVAMARKLVELRDRSFPGQPVWNTEEGWWGAKEKTPEIGAVMIPRLYLPQMAAGVEKIYHFAAMNESAAHRDPTYLQDEKSHPWPAFVSYATMTRLLEHALYIGEVDLGEGAFGYLFQAPSNCVLAAWCVKDERKIELRAGVSRATVVDLMGRSRERRAKAGKLTLLLSPRTQYVLLPRNDWTISIAKRELARQLAALNLEQIPTDDTDWRAADLNRLYHLIKAAEQSALAGDTPPGAAHRGLEAETLSSRKQPRDEHLGSTESRPPEQAASRAREVVEAREGPDGYLRRARVALGWTERLADLARHHPGEVGRDLAWAAGQAATVTELLARDEAPAYPGVVVNAYLEPSKVRDGADPKRPLDERFAFEISEHPGDTFELELTVWDYYRHPIAGTLAPRLPAGWAASPERVGYRVEPGQFQRFVFSITIPSDAPADLYRVGGVTQHEGQDVMEIHPQRVKLGP